MGPSLAGSGRMNVNNLYLERLLMWLLNRIWFFEVFEVYRLYKNLRSNL